MVRADGHVVVLDFGLSRAQAGATAPRRVVGSVDLQLSGEDVLIGTPAYMSPEQLLHQEADARSDQFGFCVALYEGLYGQRPFIADTLGTLTAAVTAGRHAPAPTDRDVPVWIRRVIERGLLRDPQGRWPDMDALLAALARDPQRRRRIWLATGLAVAGLLGLGYGVAAHRLAQPDACSGAVEELRGVWDDERRVTIDAAMRATGVAYADGAATAVRVHLDRYHDAWVAAHTAGCEAHRRGHLSTPAFDRRMVCLRERRTELAATVEVLAQTSRASAARAADAAAGMPAVADCEDDAALAAAGAEAVPFSPEVEAERVKVARLRALDRGGRYADALAEGRPILAEAERLGHAPLLAEVLLLTGKWRAQIARADEARGALTRALYVGLAAGQDAVAAEALAIRIYVVSSLEHRAGDALADEELAWAIMQRAGRPPVLAAGLHNTLGTAYDELGEQARSVGEYERGLELIGAHAPDHPLRWALVHNLATALVTMDQRARAEELAREALGRLSALQDPCHPHASVLRMLVGSLERERGAFTEAAESLKRSLVCLGEDYPHFTGATLGELAETHRRAGDRASAGAALTRAEALYERVPEIADDRPLLDIVRADFHLDVDAFAEARAVLEASRPRVIQIHGVRSHHLVPVDTRLALLALRRGDVAAAQGHVDVAAPLDRAALPARERALYAEAAARVLRAGGGPEEQVAAHVAEATNAYAAAGPIYAARAEALRAWLASPRGP